jgi:hypothetical protein
MATGLSLVAYEVALDVSHKGAYVVAFDVSYGVSLEGAYQGAYAVATKGLF